MFTSAYAHGRFYSDDHIPYKIKNSRGETFTIRQQYSLCRENFHGLPMITYFRVSNYKAGKLSMIKHLRLVKNRENRESFSPRTFYRIQYT